MGPHKRSTSALMGGVVVGTCTLCTITSAFNKSYVSPLISLVGALMVNTILNLLGFWMLVVGLGPPLGPLRALPSPSQFPYLLFLFASKAGISLLGH